MNSKLALNSKDHLSPSVFSSPAVRMGADLFWVFFSFFLGHFFFWSVGSVPAFFPAHVVWLGGVFVVVWWCLCGGVCVVVFLWCFFFVVVFL